jgi:hypothetical protein
VSEWGDISICWLGIRTMCPLGHIILIPDQQIDMSPHSDTHYPDSEPTDRYVTPLGHIILIPGHIYLLVRNQDNVSEWGDISICWSGIRRMFPSGVTYLSVGPESG